jgi:glycosyltransferase involved in cell wall biosynthesis
VRICSPQLGVAPNATLGGEVYDREILTHLAALGVEVEVILPAGLPYPANVPWRVMRVPLRKGYRWQVSNLIFVPYIGQAYRRQPFDLLRVHSLRFTGLGALWARRIFRLPVPIVAHHHHVDRDRWTQAIDARVARQVDRTITGSEFSRRQMVSEFGISSEQVKVAYYGISDTYHPGVRHVAPRAANGERVERRKTLLHVGSLIARKNLPVLLHALQIVVCEESHCQLVFIGRGPEESTLRALTHELGLDDYVIFAGFVSEGQKLEYYATGDLLVSASGMEGFGLAVGEAMACGLPVAVTNAGSLPELVVDGVCGLVVPVDDAAALASALLRLLGDPDLAARFGQAGASRVAEKFRWPMTAKETLQYYDRELAQR